MDRRLYLDMCQEVSLLGDGFYGVKKDVPLRLQVEILQDNNFAGIKFYPDGYILEFKHGKTCHSCVLHELKTNATVRAYLGQVVPVQIR